MNSRDQKSNLRCSKYNINVKFADYKQPYKVQVKVRAGTESPGHQSMGQQFDVSVLITGVIDPRSIVAHVKL